MKSEELQILPEHLAAEEQCTKNKASQGSTRLESRKGAEVEAKLSEAAWMLKQESRRVFSELMSLKKRKQQFEEGQVAAARAITQKANIVYQMLRKVHANFQRVFSEMAPGLVGLGDVLGEHIDMTVVALSLVFAIQKLARGPFYLLDEIDTALDAFYHTVLAHN
ncbi:SMC3, partial [Symbiodinium sp. CCMP2592]